MNSIPIIDYAAHPAFADLNVEIEPGDELLHEMLAIDNALQDTKSVEQFQRESQPRWNRLNELLEEMVPDAALRERAEQAISKAQDTMTAVSRWKSKPQKRFRKTNAAAAEGYLQQIHDDGCAVLTFPDATRRQVIEMLSAERAETKARHEMNPIDRCSFHMGMRGEAFDLTWKTLQSMGLTTALSELFGRAIEPMYWYLAYNTASESWYQNCYADVGIPTSKFAYSHFDNDFELAKIQIYLTDDVTEENGPFAFVPGSHKWTGCKTQQFIFKEMDRTFKYPKNESLYYRPRFGSPAYRKEFLQLPRPLQGSSHLGDDVVQGSALAEQLERDFRPVTSDGGNCCVFAGGDLLHYGGRVEGADRWVLQLGVATERPHSAGPAPQQSFFRKLASKSRKYVGNKPIDAVRSILGYTDDAPKQNQYTPIA